jgi:hypothetical protein
LLLNKQLCVITAFAGSNFNENGHWLRRFPLVLSCNTEYTDTDP